MVRVPGWLVGATGAAVGCAALIAGVLIAFQSDETIARDHFASDFTCPNERVTVTARKDLAAVDLAVRPEAPPKDIAADPGRLAIWQKAAAQRAAYYDGKSVIQARGCEHEVFYICGQLRSSGATRHGCTSAEYPPAPRP
jgi:hypothetical protein